MNVGSLTGEIFPPRDMELLGEVAQQIAIAVENAIAFREITALKDKLAEEKLYLEHELRTEYNFTDIIGESETLKRVLKQVEIAAPTDSTILIQGDTGTGKELIARAIHDLSARRDRTFVKINCAAMPSGLLESESFGHEKGVHGRPRPENRPVRVGPRRNTLLGRGRRDSHSLISPRSA